jgi:hypothetical protein
MYLAYRSLFICMLTGAFEKPKELRVYSYEDQKLIWLRPYFCPVIFPRTVGSIELEQASNGL